MSRAGAARRIAVAAAYGGGGLGLLSAGAVGLLMVEAKLARRVIGPPGGTPPSADGVYGEGPGEPLMLAILGDSTAAGLGAYHPLETPGALLATGLSDVARRPVQLMVFALPGAVSADLERQVGLALDASPDIVVIMVGANDVTHRVRPALAVRTLEQAVRTLVAAGGRVVVGTCPDLGTVEPVKPPLRWLARWASRQLATAQTIAVVEAGGRTVSLGDVLGPEFAASPRTMFGPDRFHPSADGYAAAASVLLPTVCSALGMWPAEEERPQSERGEGVLPVSQAAVEAAYETGTEVAGAQVAGHDHGPRGRWALLRHRLHRPASRVQAPLRGGVRTW